MPLTDTSSGPGSGDITSVARYMKSKTCKNVFLMLGAGISTSAGIPDFRSPDTGLYANLARLDLPFPEAVFEINFFRWNPVPFYTLAKELYPGKFRPTLTHSFVKLLASKSLLHTCFTQNIDTLERRAGVPAEKIVEAHGSFASQRCIDCNRPYDSEKMKKIVMKSDIPRCEKCSGLVKPDIVFFGEGLPAKFHRAIPTLAEADLLIVMGTSLTVQPFASLAERVPEYCTRVLINQDKVGHFGDRDSDVVCLGKCDDIVRELARELGWEEELQRIWESTAESTDLDEVKGVAVAATENGKKDSNKEKERLQTEVDKLANDVEKSLALTESSSEAEKSGKGSPKEPSSADEAVLRIPGVEETTDEKFSESDTTDHSKPQSEGKL